MVAGCVSVQPATVIISPVNTAYIGLGSNLGDSFKILRDAWDALGNVSTIQLKQLSSPFRSEPVGMNSDNWFVNAAGEITTTLAPAELLSVLHEIEQQFGRQRDVGQNRYQDRTLDLDLLLYGQIVLTENKVHIPHPHLQDRLFVLVPLNEIAPSAVHPLLDKRVQDLLTQLLAREKDTVVEMVEWDKTSIR